MTNTPAIKLAASALQKTYGQRRAVTNVSLSLNPGEIVGILGPNGAGKSTTISILAGLAAADAGQVTLNGETVKTGAAEYRKHIGLVTQDIALFEELTARLNCEIFASLYGIHGRARSQRIAEVLAQVGLSERADDRVQNYSGGMKRRLNIAVALLHNPEVILLDEPTVGVDPQSRNAIFDQLEALRSSGKSILYSTHYMEEAERLCDRIVIMDHGQVIANDTVANLKARLPVSDLVDLELTGTLDSAQRASLEALGEFTVVDENNARLTASLKSLATELPILLEKIANTCATITHLSTRRAGLEALFLQLTGRQLRDEDDPAGGGGGPPVTSTENTRVRVV